MPSSPDPCKAFGLSRGSKKQRKGEDNAAFLSRIVKTAKAVFVKCDGDIPTAALVYGIPLKMMEDIVAANRRTLGPTITKARAVAAAKVHAGKEDVKAAKKLLKAEVGVDEDKRLKRKVWPKDEDKRAESIRAALLVSLIENDGDIVEAGECLNLAVVEIQDVMEGDAELLEAQNRGLKVQVARAESSLFKKMKVGDNQATKMVLQNLDPDRWSDKSTINVRGGGFEPPSEKETETASVLSIVKGKKDA